MNSKWTSIVSSLLTIACVTTLQGQPKKTNTAGEDSSQKVDSSQQENSSQEDVCGETKRPMRVTARHIEANGIGYNQGYTTLEGFFSPLDPWGVDENWVPFLDLRGHAFNDGKFAANAGLGLRYISNYVYGINAYYDYRNTHHQHYNQFAAGLEALGKIWDFRINGYLPLGRRNSNYYQTHFGEFKKHSIYLSRKKQVSLKGANAEVGYHLDHFQDFPFYFAGGLYYLHGTGRTAWGGQLRARLDIYDYLTLDGNISYDHLFRWVGQGQVSVNFPFGERRQIKKSSDRSCTNSMALSTRALQRVDRFEIIPVDTKKVLKKAIDPVTGDPYVVWFVDNTSHSLGTYESPFNTLVNAQNNSNPNDIIYVFVGDGTDNGMNAGIALKAGQQLLGAGVDQFVETTLGLMKIPAQDFGLPTISNTLAPSTVPGTFGPTAVALNQGNNVVSGLMCVDTLGTSSGPSSTVTSAIEVQSGLNYVIKNNILSTFGSTPSVTGNCMNIYGGGNLTVENNIFIGRDTTDTYGVDMENFIGAFEGYYLFENNLFTGQNENSGLADGFYADIFTTPEPIGNLTISLVNNTSNSQTNPNSSAAGFYILSHVNASQTVTLNIMNNNVNIPAGISASNARGMSIASYGPGLTYANLQDNVSLTISPKFGYIFNAEHVPSAFIINFEPNNVGTVEYLNF